MVRLFSQNNQPQLQETGLSLKFIYTGAIMFKPTYLYVKTHRITGLQYLGKTSRTDPYSYPGSGKRWRAHLDKHGYDFETKIFQNRSINLKFLLS